MFEVNEQKFACAPLHSRTCKEGSLKNFGKNQNFSDSDKEIFGQNNFCASKMNTKCRKI